MAVPHSPRAPVNFRSPRPWAICDRCGFQYLHEDLVWQFDFRGNALSNLRILVCTVTCNDVPQPNGRRPIVIGPDPVPVRDPRPGWYATQMQGSVPGPVTPGPTPQQGNFILDSGEFGILDVNTLG